METWTLGLRDKGLELGLDFRSEGGGAGGPNGY